MNGLPTVGGTSSALGENKLKYLRAPACAAGLQPSMSLINDLVVAKE